jgi:hypothetical protein
MDVVFDELAWRCWKQGGRLKKDELSAEERQFSKLLDNELFIDDGESFHFVDDEEMHNRASRHFGRFYLTPLLNTPEEIFKLVQQTWVEESGKSIQISGRALAFIQNEGIGDIHHLGLLAIERGQHPFVIWRSLNAALPLLNTLNVQSLFELTKGTHDKSNILYGDLVEWFSGHQPEANTVIRIHLRNPAEDTANLYKMALLGLAKSKFSEGFKLAIEGCRSSDICIAGPAIDALGLLDYTLSDRLSAFEEAFEFVRGLIKTPESKFFVFAAKTLTHLVAIQPSSYESLLELGAIATPSALYPLSTFIMRESRKFEEHDWIFEIALLCAATKSEHHGIITNLDLFLSGWANKPAKSAQVIQCLEKWIEAQEYSTIKSIGIDKSFISTFEVLMHSPPALSVVVTDWLTRDDFKFPLAAERIINSLISHRINILCFDKGQIDHMDDAALLFLVRRTLGYVYHDSMLQSLIWSLTTTVDAENRVFGLVGSVFIDHIGYDYPHSTKKFLSTVCDGLSEDDPLYNLCQAILSNINKLFVQLNNLPSLKEMLPNDEKAKIINKKRQKQSRSLKEAIEENSPFLSTITKIPLKAGRSYFFLHKGNYTEKTKLSTISSSITVARSAIIDEAGAFRQISLFRVCRRGEA